MTQDSCPYEVPSAIIFWHLWELLFGEVWAALLVWNGWTSSAWRGLWRVKLILVVLQIFSLMGDLGICLCCAHWERAENSQVGWITQPGRAGNRFPGSHYCTLNHFFFEKDNLYVQRRLYKAPINPGAIPSEQSNLCSGKWKQFQRPWCCRSLSDLQGSLPPV